MRHLIALTILVCSALLTSHPALAQFSQQGPKLVGTAAERNQQQGTSVALSADGNTAIVGASTLSELGLGFGTIGGAGAAWVWTRRGGIWSQQGSRLAASDASSRAVQGSSVSLSTDGNTAIIGGPGDVDAGAAWIWIRSAGSWTQQGTKLVGTGTAGPADQGASVDLSADGNTAIVGGPHDGAGIGAAWIWTRSGGLWTQQGVKLVDRVPSAPSKVFPYPSPPTATRPSWEGHPTTMALERRGSGSEAEDPGPSKE